MTFSFYRQRKYLTIALPFWQKVFPYKTKNLTHQRWKRPPNSSSLSPCQPWTSRYSTEQAFYRGQEAAKLQLQHSHPLPWFSYRLWQWDKEHILHLHRASVCCVGEQGNSISKEIKEMPQALSKYITVYFKFLFITYIFKKLFHFFILLIADGVIQT